jgi:hypothetical protein
MKLAVIAVAALYLLLPFQASVRRRKELAHL